MRHKPIFNRTKKEITENTELWQIAGMANNTHAINAKSAQKLLKGVAELDPWDCISGRDWSKTKLITLDDADAHQYAFEFGSLIRGYLIRGELRSASAAFIDAGFLKYFEGLFYHFHEATNCESYPLLKNREIMEFWIRAKRVIRALNEISARAMLDDDAFVKLTRGYMNKTRTFAGSLACDVVKEFYNDLASFACWCVRTGGSCRDVLKYVAKENRRERPNEERLFNEWLAVLATGCCKYLAFCDTVIAPALVRLNDDEKAKAAAEHTPAKSEKKKIKRADPEPVYASNIYTDNGFNNNAFSILKRA